MIHDAQRLLRKRFDARASRLGLSAAQWRLMAWATKEEGVPQARLAELLEIEPISVSRLIDRMEEGGWVERRADTSDRRVRMIYPTDKARAAYSEIKSLAGEVYEQALSGVGPEVRRALVQGLLAIIENLSAVEAEDKNAAETGNSEGQAA